MTRAQQMLSHAHNRVSKFAESCQTTGRAEDFKKYRTAVLGASSMLQSAGLAQAVAYWLAKVAKEKSYEQVLDDLRLSPEIKGVLPAESGDDLVRRIAGLKTTEYVRATRVFQQQLVYLKRMVEAYTVNEEDEYAKK
jgi:hypothetical protein